MELLLAAGLCYLNTPITHAHTHARVIEPVHERAFNPAGHRDARTFYARPPERRGRGGGGGAALRKNHGVFKNILFSFYVNVNFTRVKNYNKSYKCMIYVLKESLVLLFQCFRQNINEMFCAEKLNNKITINFIFVPCRIFMSRYRK